MTDNNLTKDNNYPKLECENCHVQKWLNDIWWCTVCQGNVCSACAMKSHRQHVMKPFENFDIVKECLVFYRAKIGKRSRNVDHELESIHAFCSNLENDLVDFANREMKAREAIRRITSCFTLLNESPEIETVQSDFSPVKIEKKLLLVSQLLKAYKRTGLDDLLFDINDERNVSDFRLPEIDHVIDMFFDKTETLPTKSPKKLINIAKGVSRPCEFSNEKHVTFNFKAWLLPLILVCVVTIAHSIYFKEPLYTMELTDKYTQQRRTQSLQLKYYVKPDFFNYFEGDLHVLEQKIDEQFVDMLRTHCFQERKTKETALLRAKIASDISGFEKAKYIRTPHCDKMTDLLFNRL